MELDGHLLSPAQRAELQVHLSSCPSCRADQQLYKELRAQARQRWPAAASPIKPEKVLRNMQLRNRLRWVTQPLRAILWVGFALLMLVLVQWIFANLRPTPAFQPPGSPTTSVATPEDTPTAFMDEAGKIPVEPILSGEPYGRGSWSPEGDYFFIPLLEMPPPGGDRRYTSLHFISAESGEDCQATEMFLGHQGSQENYAWLDNERVLFIDINGRALLFTRCQEGAQDLGELFDEPLLRVAQPYHSARQAEGTPLLLEAPSSYWLLDPATLEARALADPVPTSDVDLASLEERILEDPIPTLELFDSFAWLPSGHQMSVLQPVEDRPEKSLLVLLNLDSGQVLSSLEIEASREGRAPLLEWMGAERAFVWSFGADGPVLIDLSVEPPQQVYVLPELLGLDLTYPDQMSSMGVFYSPTNDSFHIVAHINLTEDQSIYLYHSETDQVEQLAGDRQVMMILPDDQRMALVPWQDTPIYDDGYDLTWVDQSEQPQTHLHVSGHTPRNYPSLSSRLLPGGKRMLFGSSQGISLVGLPGGEMLAFWRLSGAENASLTNLSPAPHGRALIAIAYLVPTDDNQESGNLLYWLRLEK